MKKLIFLFLFLAFFSISNAQDNNINNTFLSKLEENFDKACFEYFSEIQSNELNNNLKDWKYNTYKLNLNSISDLKIIQNNYLIPFKSLYKEEYFINYTNEYWIIQKNQNDNNQNTFIDIDTIETREIVYELDKELIANSFRFNFNYEAKENYIKLYTSNDWKNFYEINKSNISDFDIKFIKLKIECNKNNCIREKIKIFELNFIEIRNVIAINSFFDKKLEIYSRFNCKDKKYNQEAKSYNNFTVDLNTQEIKINLSKNPIYNPQKTRDYDGDGIIDDLDNCPKIFNQDQLDTWATWIWDACSDKDRDWILWYRDNCPNVYNPDQKDSNGNGIWDACEIDSDWDWVPDIIDNCPFDYNPNQEDRDKDWIWDKCDNCPNKYNPNQQDVDKDWIWDVCDEIDNRYMESNSIFFIWLLIFITIIFGAWIFFIVNKLNSKQ